MEVFISHSSKDKPIARRVHRRLNQLGINCFLDEHDLRVGSRLSADLKSHIRKAKCLAVIWSANSVASKWVDAEIQFARGGFMRPSKKVIPLIMDDTPLSLELSDHKGISFIDSFSFERPFRRFVEALKTNVDSILPEPQREIAEICERAAWAAKLAEIGSPREIDFASLPKSHLPEAHDLDALLYAKAVSCSNDEVNTLWAEITAKIYSDRQVGHDAALILDGRAKPGSGLLTHHFFHKLHNDINLGSRYVDGILEIAESSPTRPVVWASIFLRKHWMSCTVEQLTRFLALAGPSTYDGYGYVVDMVAYIGLSDAMQDHVFRRFRTWIERGQFDGRFVQPRAEDAGHLFLCLETLEQAGKEELTDRICEIIRRRLQSNLRAGEDQYVRIALHWVIDTLRNRLDGQPDRNARWSRFPKWWYAVLNGFDDGTSSSDFESWEDRYQVRDFFVGMRRVLSPSCENDEFENKAEDLRNRYFRIVEQHRQLKRYEDS